MSSSKTCIRCAKPAKYCCSRCKQFWYCSDVCQKQHWYHGHKGQCAVLSGSVQSSSQINAVKQSTTADAASQATSAQAASTNASTAASAYLKPPKAWLYDRERAQKLMVIKPKIMNQDGVGAGLKNVGNTCYFNSVIQAMVYTEPLQVFLRADHAPTQCSLTKQAKFCLICAMKDLQKSLLDENYESLVPKKILMNLREINMDFFLGQQEDAHELHSCILQKMHSAFVGNAADVMKALEPADRMRAEETSLIYQLFGGHQLSHVRCTECGRITENVESFLDLNLDLSSHAASVEEALRNWCKIEVLPKGEGYRCEKCDRAVAVQKQLTICEAPPILVIQMKRFDMMRGGLKINKSVAFHEELDLSDIGILTKGPEGQSMQGNFKYQLYAMIAHYGSTLHSGHYVAFVNVGNRWFLFDDDKVRLVDISIVLKQNAYLLYYRRIAPGSSQSALKSSGETQQQRSKLKESSELPAMELHASQEVKQQESLIFLTPIYSLFYETDGAEISKLLLTAETPLEDDLSACMSIEAHVLNGTTNFIFKTRQYRLELDIPFSVEIIKSKAVIYQTHRTVVVELPVLSADSEASQAEQTRQQIAFGACSSPDKSPMHDYTFDAEQKLDLDAKLDDEAHRLKSTEDEKFIAGMQKIESINVETNSYGQLWRDIEAFYQTAQKTRPVALAATPKMDKVKPNDPCPCQSGAKFKKCHGKNN